MPNLVMPQLGESVTEGTIIKWLKSVGDPIASEEPLVEIETEKVNVEVPSPWGGVITAILVPEGETVAVGVDLATIGSEAATPAPSMSSAEDQTAIPAAPSQPVQATPAPASATTPIKTPTADGSHAQRYSPAVLRLAQEHDLDLSRVSGSGFGGRVTRKDVVAWIDRQGSRDRAKTASAPMEPAVVPASVAVSESAAGQPPSPPADVAETIEPLSATRRAIAQHMLRSVQTSPHAWMAIEVEVDKLVHLRERLRTEFRTREGADLTYLPFMVKAVARALKENPRLNASWSDKGVIIKPRINLGIAVDTDDGLVVPVIHDAGDFTIAGLARRLHDIAERARAHRLQFADVEGGTFTVDNTGAFGSVVSAPIINQPQAAIVTMETITRRPVVVGDGIAIRSMMNCCISFDHRILDGGHVGRFMRSLKRELESIDDSTSIY